MFSQRQAPPRLVITEQPQQFFKYRYASETTKSTHGFVYGKTSPKKRRAPKKYPQVELQNYIGKVLFLVSLVQKSSNEDHPNTFAIIGKNGVRSMSSTDGRFEKLCIVIEKKEVIDSWILEKYPGLDEMDKRTIMEKRRKINLNVVRLKFSAIDAETKKEICSPVYSNPIKNSTNPATNKLAIKRMSVKSDCAKGGKECFLVTTRFTKGNIKVRFFEESSDGQVLWEAYGGEGETIDSNVIIIRVPPYKNLNITRKVSVSVQILRHSDNAASEPVSFEYTPDPLARKFSFIKRTFQYSIEPTPPLTPGREDANANKQDFAYEQHAAADICQPAVSQEEPQEDRQQNNELPQLDFFSDFEHLFEAAGRQDANKQDLAYEQHAAADICQPAVSQEEPQEDRQQNNELPQLDFSSDFKHLLEDYLGTSDGVRKIEDSYKPIEDLSTFLGPLLQCDDDDDEEGLEIEEHTGPKRRKVA